MTKNSSKSILLGHLKDRWNKIPHFKALLLLVLLFWNLDITLSRFNETRILDKNKIKLTNIQDAIEAYQKINGEIPESLLDLYLWCINSKDLCVASKVNPMDYQGRRIDFQRLDRSNYFLKIYSELSTLKNPNYSQMKEIHLSSTNLIFSNIRNQPNPVGVPDLKSRSDILNQINGVSADGKWMVKIFTDFTLGRRRLALMRKSSEVEDASIYLAPQLLVEEFSWITNKGDFVFSIASDQSFESGVYLWTIHDQKIKKIWPEDSSISLNHTNLTSVTNSNSQARQEGHLIAFVNSNYIAGEGSCFFAKKNFEKPVSPSDLFGIQNLYCIKYDESNSSIKISDYKESTALPNNFLQVLTNSEPYKELPENKNLNFANMEKEQQEWLKLPIGSNLGETLELWNTYTETYAQSSIGPYAMWTLIRLYSTAIFEIEKTSPLSFEDEQKAQHLRTLCFSLSKALAQHPLSPIYLNAFAADLYENLARNPSLTYGWAPGVFR